ncbi:MAG: BON domain-containing protein [Rhodocyclaceae bacterium]|nr:BON domain-containing protein [Rhodocyclaceae bacterium]
MKRSFIATAVAASLLCLPALPVQAAEKPAEPGAMGQLISDSGLSARIKAALAVNDATDALDIEVNTTRGVVTLRGMVDSFDEADEAVRTAAAMDGVQAVRNELEIVAPGARDGSGSVGRYLGDGALTAKVKAALAADPVTEAIEIEVSTTRGLVTLVGYVDGGEEMRQAIGVTLAIDGVKGVRNHMLLAARQGDEEPGAIGQYISDSALTARVKTALAIDDVTEASEIEVETNRGVVTLSGRVDGRQEVERAIAVAASVDGVRRVENALSDH